MPVKLGVVADIFVGLQTSADDVFIMNYVSDTAKRSLKSKSLEKNWVFEKQLLHPIVSGTDVSPEPLPSRQYVLFPYQVENDHAEIIPLKSLSDSWPRTAEYLKETKHRLEARESDKLKGTSKWHGYIYLKNMTRQSVPKLCVARLVEYCALTRFSRHTLSGQCGCRWGHFQRYSGGLQFGLSTCIDKLVRLAVVFSTVAAPFQNGFWSADKQISLAGAVPPG